MSGPTNLSFVHKLFNSAPVVPKGAPTEGAEASRLTDGNLGEDGSPPMSTIGSLSISTERFSGTELMAASGFFTDTRPGLIGDKQLAIQEKLHIKTSAQDKIEGLKQLRRCIYQVERQMNRSISRDLAGTRALSAGEAVLQPKLSATGREMLAFCCQVLQHLMGSDDKSLIMAEKVESWLPIAAELFGRALGALFRGSVDQDEAIPHNVYLTTVIALLKQIQGESQRLSCPDCAADRPHPLNLVQLKLLVVLKVHLAMWNNARQAAEEVIGDVIWPVQVSLHSCQKSLRKAANRILAQAIRAHRTLRAKAAKGIEVLAVTSFDAASSGLARPSNRLRANYQVTYYLETLATLWQDSALTLRYKLNSVRREYYDVRTTWDAITSVVQVRMQVETSRQICVILPLLAYADPVAFADFALQDVVAVLTSAPGNSPAEYIRVLGHIIKAVGTGALRCKNAIFQFLIRNLEDKIETDTCFEAATDFLMALGPCAAAYFADIVDIAKEIPVTLAQLSFVTKLPALVPTLQRTVHQFVAKEIRKRIDGGATPEVSLTISVGYEIGVTDTTDMKTANQWVALLRVLPVYTTQTRTEIDDNITQLIKQALLPNNPTVVIEEALQQLKHPALIREEGSPLLVHAILGLIQERREPRLLERSLARLSQPRLQFQMQAVTLPLLLQLGTSDIKLQRVVASLLTIQAARFPSLIVPILRKFVRTTLLRIDNEISASGNSSSGSELQLLATVCIAIPSLPLALSEMYSRPVITLLLSSLRKYETIGRDAPTTITCLANLAKHCSHVWYLKEIEEAIVELKRLSQPPHDSGDSTLALACIAALMAIPQSRPLQDGVMQEMYGTFLKQDTLFPPTVKCKVMAVIGAIGTADRNPVRDRDHNAALRREDSLYDAGQRRRVATAVLRDKFGASSIEYQLSIISDNLLTTANRRPFSGKIAVWTTLLKLCLMVPEERYADRLPDILEDIIEQYELHAEGKIVKAHRAKLLVLISQAILLKPVGYEKIWPTLYQRLMTISEEPDLKSSDASGLLLIVLSVISKMRGEIKSIARQLLPLLLRIMEVPALDTGTIVFCLKLIAVFQSHTDAFVGSIARRLIRLVDQTETVVLEVLRLLAHLADYVSLFEATLVIREMLEGSVFCDLKDTEGRELRDKVEASLTFAPTVPQDLTFAEYPDLRPYQDMQFSNLALTEADRADHSFVAHLWNCDDAREHSDWQSWARRLEHHIVDACRVDIIKVVSLLKPRVPKGLLHAGFIAYYEVLGDQERSIVQDAIGNIVTTSEAPPYVRDLWLSILEFTQKSSVSRLPAGVMEMARRSLSKEKHRLSERADPVVLWYAEIDAGDLLNEQTLTSLIEANLRVGRQEDAAWSTMQLAEQNGVWLQSAWFESLGRWEDAIKANRVEGTRTFEAVDTLITSQHALLNFPEVLQIARYHYPSLPHIQKAQISHWCTVAAWAQGDFEAMGRYLSSQPKGATKHLYKAILETYHENYEQATAHIAKAQSEVYDELQARTAYLDFSANNYASAITTLAKSQMLVELEEVIRYKQSDHHPELQKVLADTWQSRLKSSHVDIDSFYKRLLLWSLAAKPEDLQDGWLYLAKLADDKGLKTGRRIIETLKKDDQPGDKVFYTKLRFDWEETHNRNHKSVILQQLYNHALNLSSFCGFAPGTICRPEAWVFPQPDLVKGGTRLHRRRLARSLVRLSQWTQELRHEWIEDGSVLAYEYIGTAVMLDPNWSQALGLLAEMALDIQQYKQSLEPGHVVTEGMIERYILPACYALFQAIKVDAGPEQSVKATLLALTLWFRFGGTERKVLAVVKTYLRETPTRTWLPAIPQLIARLGAKDMALRYSLVDFLMQIAGSYADALIWPLLTASMTPRSVHQSAALDIMQQMAASPELTAMVKQAQMVGKELILSAISPAERWKNAIEKMLYVEGLSASSWLILSEEYETLKIPQSEEEYLFIQRFGDALYSAKGEVERYLAGAKSAFYKACSEYQNIYRKIYSLLDTWRRPNFQLNLRLIAPRIAAMQDSHLTVPGQFDARKQRHEQQFIDRFEPMVDVLNTKQLPRKLVMHSKTERWTFLLKGNEDLRQDERIMQLITLTNTLLNHNNEAYTRQLFVQPYSVIPLSPDSGLCQWVPNTETLMSMVTAGRAKVKGQRLTDREFAAMFASDPKELQKGGFDYDKAMTKYEGLPLHEKLERYRSALAVSKHTDLKEILWRRSSSSQTWLLRRTCFARSIATTSMIGYVIGLGDRHPGNILIEQTKFNAISIDFGDVFEAAAERTAFPEHVPFRLTPEIYNAFEFAAVHGVKAPGSRGHFKMSSIMTLGVLREHKDTLLAMLEAFALDPLLTWQAKEVENPAAEDTYDEKRDQAVPPPIITGQTDRSTSSRPLEKSLVTERRRKETEVVVNLGGSFIAAGSLANPKVPHAGRGLARVEEESQRGSGSIDVNLTMDRGKERLVTVLESTAPSTTTHSQGLTNTGTGTAVTRGTDGEESYMAKKMAHIMTNERAFKVLNRIEQKLAGTDSQLWGDRVGAVGSTSEGQSHGKAIEVDEQVQYLIEEATKHENLAQGYPLGWLPTW